MSMGGIYNKQRPVHRGTTTVMADWKAIATTDAWP